MKRLLLSLLGFGLVFLIVYKTGFEAVFLSLQSSMIYVPLILLGELGFGCFSALAERALYGEDRHRIPWREVFRAGCAAYAMMGLVPVGRVAAEATRAVLLAPYVGKSKAASVAVQMQVLSLCVTAGFASLCALYFAWIFGASYLTWAVFWNALVLVVLSSLAWLAIRYLKLGQRLAFLLPKDFDVYFKESAFFSKKAIFLESLARCSQIFQNGILVFAVGGVLGLTPALCSEGLHLLGASIGDILPAQLGATEWVYTQAESVLGVSPERALSIAILAHMAQLFWVLVALLVNACRD